MSWIKHTVKFLCNFKSFTFVVHIYLFWLNFPLLRTNYPLNFIDGTATWRVYYKSLTSIIHNLFIKLFRSRLSTQESFSSIYFYWILNQSLWLSRPTFNATSLLHPTSSRYFSDGKQPGSWLLLNNYSTDVKPLRIVCTPSSAHCPRTGLTTTTQWKAEHEMKLFLMDFWSVFYFVRALYCLLSAILFYLGRTRAKSSVGGCTADGRIRDLIISVSMLTVYV